MGCGSSSAVKKVEKDWKRRNASGAHLLSVMVGGGAQERQPQMPKTPISKLVNQQESLGAQQASPATVGKDDHAQERGSANRRGSVASARKRSTASDQLRISGKEMANMIRSSLQLTLSGVRESSTSNVAFALIDLYAGKCPTEIRQKGCRAAIDFILACPGIKWSEVNRARAAFALVGHHVTYDIKAYLLYQEKGTMHIADNLTADLVLATGLSSCAGYTRLFQELCELVGLQCRGVRGLSKGFAFKIGSTLEEEASNHKWNAVYVDEEWRLIETTWAAGYIDFADNSFVKNYDSAGNFMPPAFEFALRHFPMNIEGLDEPESQYLPTPFSRYDFARLISPDQHFFSLGLWIELKADDAFMCQKGSCRDGNHLHTPLQSQLECAKGTLSLVLGGKVPEVEMLAPSVYRLSDEDDQTGVMCPDMGYVSTDSAKNTFRFSMMFSDDGLYRVRFFGASRKKQASEPAKNKVFREVLGYEVRVAQGVGSDAGFVCQLPAFDRHRVALLRSETDRKEMSPWKPEHEDGSSFRCFASTPIGLVLTTDLQGEVGFLLDSGDEVVTASLWHLQRQEPKKAEATELVKRCLCQVADDANITQVRVRCPDAGYFILYICARTKDESSQEEFSERLLKYVVRSTSNTTLPQFLELYMIHVFENFTIHVFINSYSVDPDWMLQVESVFFLPCRAS